ncbi:MAG: metallo-mystery pair system four-Cys motif protein [Myxococcales bacterium]|nr:MAG: metallo-mystery pair system four-Cys motif protein [Myxococcales bacterium]
MEIAVPFRLERFLYNICLVVALFSIACSQSDPDSPTSSPNEPQSTEGAVTHLSLQFSAEVSGKAIQCGSVYHDVGLSQATVEFADFRFYINDIQLIDTDGHHTDVTLNENSKWQYDNLVLLDFEDGTGLCESGNPDLNTVVELDVPEGNYDGISFKFGVPFVHNHIDLSNAPPPLSLTSMFWSWLDGYKFARIEVGVTDGNPVVFPFHLGSTGCTGWPEEGEVKSCSHENLAHIELHGFDPSKNTIVFDYAALMAETDLKNAYGAPGCMSEFDDSDCPSIFEQLGLDFSTGSQAASAQTVFHAK